MSDSSQESLATLSEEEFEALVQVLLEEQTWEKYIREVLPDGRDEPPAWLLSLTSRLEISTLYEVEQEESGSCSLGIKVDPERGDAWTYKTWTEGIIPGERLAPAAGSLTSAELWPLVEADLGDTGDACLYGTFWCHADLVPEDEIRRYLKNLMESEGLDRLEGGDGPTMEEWLMRNYHGKEKQS
jgi:hypothetical protein